MFNARYIICFLITVAPFLPTQAQSLQKTNVFESGTDGYASYRIPAIIQAKDETILAFAEGRKNGSSDTGDIDLVMKKSKDNGKTWSNLQVIWDDGHNVCGNPVPVVDRKSGKIILVACWNNGNDPEKSIIAGTSSDTRRVFVLTSDDDGTTWSTPRDITSSVKKENWTWYATGPCHGIQLQNRKNRGRILIPANHITALPENAYHSHCIYSDDKGATWHLGGTAEGEGNESTVTELKNGKIMLNMRNYNREAGKCRLVAISNNGGESFQPSYLENSLVEPRCQGSLLNYMHKGKRTRTLLFSNPANETKRINMTISISHDNGKNFEKKITVFPGRSAYSDMVVLPSGNIGILYENGMNDLYERISFEVLPSKLFK